MSDTPETDAIADFYLAKAFSKDPADRTVPCQFAARLKRDLNRAIRERDEAREERDKLQVMRKEVVAANKGAKINAQVSNSLAGKLNKAERERDEALEAIHTYKCEVEAWELLQEARRERDEARELLRILAGLVAYGLGQSGEEWSLEAMRQATTAIQNAKSLEAAK